MSRTRPLSTCDEGQNEIPKNAEETGAKSLYGAQERTKISPEQFSNQLKSHLQNWTQKRRTGDFRVVPIRENKIRRLCLPKFSLKKASERILAPAKAPTKTQWDIFQDQIVSGDAQKSLKSTDINID